MRVFCKVKTTIRRSGLDCLCRNRGFSALPQFVLRDEVECQVLVEGRAQSRGAILNRPGLLNSLSNPMVGRLVRLYQSWEENPDLGFVYMKGNGKAFCSGADVVFLSQLLEKGKIGECKKFFETLYKFVYLQGTYLKPHVAILNGSTMGCGAGISLPGMFRVVTDRTVFCHPEAQLGFHPDAGASYYLSRLPGYLGEYLALTGDKLNGAEMIAVNLATHYALDARLAMVEERLGNLMTDDATVIESTIAQYGDIVYPDSGSVLHRMKVIDNCFSHDTVEEIVDALETEAADSCDNWCKSTLRKMKEASPISLKVILRSIREGRFQTLDQCLSREYRITVTAITKNISNNFAEGIRARLIDKDFAPSWDPPHLSHVSKDMVDKYFLPLGEEEPELQLPTTTREPYV